ncbi:MAG: metal ABC transporter permease [Planctomycetia bacterium]|nr:metal ABC transporter permease [Planctomycetia bacterium]
MIYFLQYPFMQRAVLVGILLAIIIPCVGIIIVLKRLSLMGDTLSHTSLAGVAMGLLLGWEPTLCAVLYCVAAALSIEWIRRMFPQYEDISLAIMMSLGIGLAGVLSGYVRSVGSFNDYLFGSIVAISDLDVYLVIGITVAVVLTFFLLYRELFVISFDEKGARLAGISVGRINFIFTILTAVTVAVAARTVGALIVSSMLVIPVACAMQFGKSYKQTVFFSIFFAFCFMITGLLLSFNIHDLKPGGAIVLIGVVVLLMIFAVKSLMRRFR